MKLLEKRKINENIQAEKKLQIDSGIFLAEKVDKLRQDLLSLEKQRDEFIKNSHEKLDAELGYKKAVLADVQISLKNAEKRLSKLREPLDEEWKQLEILKDEVFKIKLSSEEYFQLLINERQVLFGEKQQIDELTIEIEKSKHKIHKLLNETEENHKEIKKLREETQSIKENKEAELFLKELSLLEREKALEKGQEILGKEKLELNKEKKFLSIKKQRIG